MLTENYFENPISLNKIKTDKILDKYSLVLKNDIWKKGLLLLRSGLYLSEEVVDKLINFGIQEVNVHYYEDNCEEERYVEMLKRNMLKAENVFIFDKNIRNSVYLANILIHTGYKRGNIFTLTQAKYTGKYFKTKKPDYLVIDYESNSENFINILKEVYSNTHIFLMVDEETKNLTSFKKLQNSLKAFKINLVSKPVSLGYFLKLINDCIDSDFSELLKNEQSELTLKKKLKL